MLKNKIMVLTLLITTILSLPGDDGIKSSPASPPLKVAMSLVVTGACQKRDVLESDLRASLRNIKEVNLCAATDADYELTLQIAENKYGVIAYSWRATWNIPSDFLVSSGVKPELAREISTRFHSEEFSYVGIASPKSTPEPATLAAIVDTQIVERERQKQSAKEKAKP